MEFRREVNQGLEIEEADSGGAEHPPRSSMPAWRSGPAAVAGSLPPAILDWPLVLGQVVAGKYRLARFLGNGAFGWVFEAEELYRGQVVGRCALKLLHPRDAQARESVVGEMRAGAGLTRGHQGLLSHLTFGDVAEPGPLQGFVYLAMELAEESLGDRLRRPARLSAAETRQMARDVAEALAWLHSRGAVHRDVKPDNVLYADGHWKLGDLGLMRPVDGSLVQTVSRQGTPLYVAPEVMQDQVGTSVDVWALGVMVQQCLTGVLPYNGVNEVALYGALATRKPTIAPDLPAPFDAVVRGCLVKDPGRRWTAAQVAQALSGASPASAPAAVRDASMVDSSAPAPPGDAQRRSVAPAAANRRSTAPGLLLAVLAMIPVLLGIGVVGGSTFLQMQLLPSFVVRAKGNVFGALPPGAEPQLGATLTPGTVEATPGDEPQVDATPTPTPGTVEATPVESPRPEGTLEPAPSAEAPQSEPTPEPTAAGMSPSDSGQPEVEAMPPPSAPRTPYAATPPPKSPPGPALVVPLMDPSLMYPPTLGVDPNMVPPICTCCGGTGRCGVCAGTGIYMAFGVSVPCKNCSGCGLCPFCHGTGRLMPQASGSEFLNY